MENELIERIREYINAGDRLSKENKSRLAFKSYMEALYAISVYLVYRDLGMLLPAGAAVGVLRSRYPDIYSIIEKHAAVQDEIPPEALRALRADLEKIYSMI
ncbi:hypothetical protein [Thermococcus sp.]